MKQLSEDIKKDILNAAQARFGLYGYNKTTMAEIATDCNMSAGNLYRYYTNKTDIGAECAKTYFDNCEHNISLIIRRTDLSLIQRIEEFTISGLLLTHKLCAEQPKVSELIAFIAKERIELINDHKARKASLLSEILTEGNRTGEFNINDVQKTAETIMLSTSVFHAAPMILVMLTCGYSIEDLQQKVKNVVTLLVTGLLTR